MHLPEILEVLRDPTYIPLTIERLAEELDIPEKEFEEFETEVKTHLRQGTLVKLKKNRVCLPRDADLVTGKLRFRQSGSALLLPDFVEDAPPKPQYHVNAEDTGVAMHGDRVVCRIHHDRRNFRQRKGKKKLPNGQEEKETARVIRILERANETLAGTLKRSRMFHFVIPGDPRIIQDILVPDPKDSDLNPKPKIDDKVVVELAPWEQRHLNPEGEIIKVLGKTHTPQAEYAAIYHQYSLNPDFPDPVQKEAERIPTKLPPEAYEDRTDIRNVFTLTIDPQDAKDFDDALSLDRMESGNLRIGVHIADVSYYVKPGTGLDREARERGNSTYLVGVVIPMLPHALSNGICSLVEDEDRLTKSVFFEFTPQGKMVGHSFANTVIRSNKRLTYEQAYAFLFENDFEKIRALPVPPKHQTGSTGRMISELKTGEMKEIQSTVRRFWKFASRMRKERMKAGSLELDMPECKIYVDSEGYADTIVKVEQDESHQLIEEFMLAANEAVAKTLNEKNLPAIHRVHDEPDPDKLDDFGEFVASMGIPVGDLSSKRVLNTVLKKIKDHPQAHMLRIQFLRSLKQACYRASPDGHFGLSKKHYTHFTSPIRRYSDLVVHRIFDRHLLGNKDNIPNYKPSDLGAIAQHLSITEQNSTEAERESNKLKLMEFFERELTKKEQGVFKAVIMDVRNHGMFVELTASMAYGLIHISTLSDDLYKLSADGTSLVGRRQGRVFRMGETTEVSVARVDRFKRQIDFQVAHMKPNRGDRGGKNRSRRSRK